MRRSAQHKTASQDAAEDFAIALDQGRPLQEELQSLLTVVERLVAAGDEASTIARLPELDLKGALKRRALQAIAGADPQRVDLTPAGTLISHGGTGSAYSNYGCRCIECTEANRARAERRRTERKRQGPPKDAHGSSSTYSNWSCRCVWCRRAAAHAAALNRATRSGAGGTSKPEQVDLRGHKKTQTVETKGA